MDSSFRLSISSDVGALHCPHELALVALQFYDMYDVFAEDGL
jgi:hypothetical protein